MTKVETYPNGEEVIKPEVVTDAEHAKAISEKRERDMIERHERNKHTYLEALLREIGSYARCGKYEMETDKNRIDDWMKEQLIEKGFTITESEVTRYWQSQGCCKCQEPYKVLIYIISWNN